MAVHFLQRTTADALLLSEKEERTQPDSEVKVFTDLPTVLSTLYSRLDWTRFLFVFLNACKQQKQKQSQKQHKAVWTGGMSIQRRS